ncbi:hypothetical protein BX666DRAFT_1170866 [Dichotomocladium elegans]|nr:hypothetical protein BX666DRAFT_1170866 [Dichotomocladium elegans]
MSEADTDERPRSPRSRSRSRSPGRGGGHGESRYRSRSRSRDLPPREDVDINPGDNLFVTGLSLRTTSAELEDLFSKYGKIQKAEVMYDPHTRESRGFGFIRMATAEEADRALASINNTEVDGRVVTVEKTLKTAHTHPWSLLWATQART